MAVYFTENRISWVYVQSLVSGPIVIAESVCQNPLIKTKRAREPLTVQSGLAHDYDYSRRYPIGSKDDYRSTCALELSFIYLRPLVLPARKYVLPTQAGWENRNDTPTCDQ